MSRKVIDLEVEISVARAALIIETKKSMCQTNKKGCWLFNGSKKY